MRFAHLSDLHLGKRVCEFSMLEDQKYILEQILTLPISYIRLMAYSNFFLSIQAFLYMILNKIL